MARGGRTPREEEEDGVGDGWGGEEGGDGRPGEAAAAAPFLLSDESSLALVLQGIFGGTRPEEMG